MAFILTYDSLITTLQSLTNRQNDQEMNANLPMIIAQAELSIGRNLHSIYDKRVVVDALDAGNAVKLKPDDWVMNILMEISDVVPDPLPNPYPNQWVTGKATKLESFSSIRETYPDLSSTGLPKVYTDLDNRNWYFSPTPDKPYTIRYVYYRRFFPLDENNQSNNITKRTPDLLIFGCLKLLYGMYIQDSAKEQYYSNAYDSMLKSYNNEEDEQLSDARTDRRKN